MKYNFTLFFAILAFVGFGQINNWQEKTTKNYDSGISITYGTLEGFENEEHIFFLESKIRQEEDLLRFEVFPSNESNKTCFIEYTGLLDPIQIVESLNNFTEELQNMKTEFGDDFPGFIRWVYNVNDFPLQSSMSRGEYNIQKQNWIYANKVLFKKLAHLEIDVLGQD